MPFLAEDNDREVIDAREDGISRTKDYNCPFCGNTLRYRKAATTDSGETIRRAHFWHTGNVGGRGSIGGCGEGGESARHEELKRMVIDHLREEHPEAKVAVEKQVGDRIADILIEYDAVYGSVTKEPLGAAIEVQVSNESKDYLETTKNYLRHDVGVYWVFDVQDGYSLVQDAIRELGESMSPPVHLGEVKDDLASLGRRIYFNNFEFTVTSLEDELAGIPQDELGTYTFPRELLGSFSVNGTEVRISHERTEEARYGKAIPDFEDWTKDKILLQESETVLFDDDSETYSENAVDVIKNRELKRISPYVFEKDWRM